MTREEIIELLDACGEDIGYIADKKTDTIDVWVHDAIIDGCPPYLVEERELNDAELVNNVKIFLENNCKEKINGDDLGEMFLFENVEVIWRLNSEEVEDFEDF